MEGKKEVTADVRLKYESPTNKQGVRFGREIDVKIKPSRKQKIKVINK